MARRPKFSRASRFWGGRRYQPCVFIEQGVAKLSSVLTSKRATLVIVAITRTHVKLRQLLATHAGLALKLAELEAKCDRQLKVVFDAIRELMIPPEPTRRSIGFTPGEK